MFAFKVGKLFNYCIVERSVKLLKVCFEEDKQCLSSIQVYKYKGNEFICCSFYLLQNVVFDDTYYHRVFDCSGKKKVIISGVDFFSTLSDDDVANIYLSRYNLDGIQFDIIDESAEQVHARICTNFSTVEKTLYEICVDLKKIRDNKYYKTLGYDTFETYCLENFNMSSRNAYRFISIAENLSSDFVTTSSQKIGLNKMYILSRLTDEERTELIESTDIENTPVKQLEQKSKEIKARGDTERDISPTSSDSEYKSQSKEVACIEKYGKRFVALVKVYKELFNSCSTLLKYEHIEDGSCFDKLDVQAVVNVANSLLDFCNYFKAIQDNSLTLDSPEAISIIDRLGEIYVNGINGSSDDNA